MDPGVKKASVLMADFQFLTKVGLTALVNQMEGFDVVGEVETTRELYGPADRYQADLLIMDFREDVDSLGIIEHITARTSMKVLVITNYLNPAALQQLLALGVRTIVTKNCSEEEIRQAIVAAHEGKRFFCNRVLDWVVDQQFGENDCEPATLTRRENEILNLVVDGKSTAEIADILHLSIHTVNTHRKNILKKLRLRSPAQLIAFALKNGLAHK